MIPPEQIAEVRRLYYAEHWKIGTIAAQLGLHPDTVRAAVATDVLNRPKTPRPRVTDPYVPFIRETLERYPTLRATRIFAMIRPRGYAHSLVQVRRLVSRLRPRQREAFLWRRTFAGEEAQADWAHFGEVAVGRARRRLSCFVLTLSYSRALALEFFFDQSLENFLRGHVRAFESFGAVPDSLDDLLARATKGRWAPRQLLEEIARAELAERAPAGACNAGCNAPAWAASR